MGKLIKIHQKSGNRLIFQCNCCQVPTSFGIELRSNSLHDIKQFICHGCGEAFVSETVPIDVMEAVVTQKRLQYAGKTIVLKFLLVVASTIAILAFML